MSALKELHNILGAKGTLMFNQNTWQITGCMKLIEKSRFCSFFIFVLPDHYSI